MAYSKTAHERQRKIARQQQRLIVGNWPPLGCNSTEQFFDETGLTLFSTLGLRLRVYDGRLFRHLTNHEFACLLNSIICQLDQRGVKLTVRKIESALREVKRIVPLLGECETERPMPASRMRGVAR